MPTISVVIPVKNGSRTIKKCLDGIFSQTVEVSEVVIVDSGSVDGTQELLQTYSKVKIVNINPEDFSHGKTRNLGVSHTSGEMVVLTVQDAWPANSFWLENLLKGFNTPDVVAVCGQQIVPHDKQTNPIQWHRSYTEPQLIKYSFAKSAYEKLSPQQKQSVCGWDDVTAMYKRDILLTLPFRDTPFAEDAWWANDAILAGYTIAYNYNAKVYHYHHEDYNTALRRNISEMYSMYRIFRVTPPKVALSVGFYIHVAKMLLRAKDIGYIERFKWLHYNVNLKKAVVTATSIFYSALQHGEHNLDKMYNEYCGFK
jgi:rhamnosyltransferase